MYIYSKHSKMHVNSNWMERVPANGNSADCKLCSKEIMQLSNMGEDVLTSYFQDKLKKDINNSQFISISFDV